jgi:hypothetical protein
VTDLNVTLFFLGIAIHQQHNTTVMVKKWVVSTLQQMLKIPRLIVQTYRCLRPVLLLHLLRLGQTFNLDQVRIGTTELLNYPVIRLLFSTFYFLVILVDNL